MESQRIVSNKPQLVTRNGKRHICGYAIRYFKPDDPETVCQFSPSTIEVIEPRIYQHIVRDLKSVKLTIDHNPVKELGMASLDEDENGVWFDYELDVLKPLDQEAINMVDTKDWIGCSFTSNVVVQRSYLPNGNKVRKLIEADDLTEVTICFDPAYPASAAVMRSRKLEIERDNLLLRYKLFKLKNEL